MFNNSSHVDASHSTFSEVHRDQYFTSHASVQGNQTLNTIVHGDQILQTSRIGLETLYKASASSASFDSAARHPAARCLEGTRVQLLDCLMRWIDGESGNNKFICWVNGRPGTGKSAISQTMAEHFASQKRLAASFFFSRRDMERRTTRHFFPTIAIHLLHSIPAIRSTVLAALEEDCMIPFKILREQMQKLLLKPLSSGLDRPGSPFLIVVDALDECDNPQLVVELVSLLVQLVCSSPLPLRLLISSRPEPWIQAHFHQKDIMSITLTLEIESFGVENDIRSFLQHALSQVYQEHSQVMPNDPWPSPEDLCRLVEKASGLFIFASTVVKFVGDRLHNPVQRLLDILDDSRSCDTAYAVLDALCLDAMSVFPEVDTVRLILGVVYYLSVPMSIPALHDLLDRRDVDARTVIPALSSVLLSSENGIQFYHASFRDFLISPQRSRRYAVDPVTYHRLIAQLCFNAMVKSLKRNMCGLDDPSKLNRDVENLEERKRLAYDEALLYACRYWSHHLAGLPSQDNGYETLLNAMQEFCSKSLLYWIETASILDEVEKAIRILHNALHWLKSLTPVPKVTAALVEDAERLLLLYRHPISQSAPHVYHTVITLAPSSTALYANFKHEAGDSFTINLGQDEGWQACRYTIDLGALTSVDFSPSGRIIATAGMDQGIRLWNVSTGGNVASLGDNASSTLVRFSGSGAYVAGAFMGGTVAVWDSNLGREHLKDVGVHAEEITCLEFSPDSTNLASGSLDHTIQLWSLDSAQRLHKLVAHEGPIRALAFTSNSQRLCSGSEDHSLILWDVGAGKMVRGMTGHRAGITTLDIARDETMVITGSQDKSVKVWDMQSGRCTRTLSKSHKKAIRSVRFFDNDKRFLSVSDGAVLASSVSKSSPDITIWEFIHYMKSEVVDAPDWRARVLVRGLPSSLLRMAWEGFLGEEERVWSRVAHSSQSSSFAFSYGNETWCALLGSKVETPPLHISQDLSLSALALSPDGTWVAAGSSAGSLDVLDATVPASASMWDEGTNKNLSAPLRFARILVVSPNGTRFLVKSVLQWYLTNGDFHLLHQVDFGIAGYGSAVDIPNPVFSADSSTFALWTRSNIWGRDRSSVLVHESTGGTRKVYFSGLKKVQAFHISPNGNFIGCGHERAITICDVGKQTKKVISVVDDSVIALEFSSDSQALLSSSENGLIQLWDTSSGTCKATLSHGGFDSPARTVGLAPLGDMAAIAHEDGMIQIVSFSTSTLHMICPSGTGFTQAIQRVQFLQEPLRLVVMTLENEVSFWTIPAGLFSPGNGDENWSPCSICRREETSGVFQSKEDTSTPLPHLISESKGQIFDYHFRTEVVVKSDGWVFRGDKRLFWLPQHLRPPPTDPVFTALNDKIMIFAQSEKVVLLTLRDQLC